VGVGVGVAFPLLQVYRTSHVAVKETYPRIRCWSLKAALIPVQWQTPIFSIFIFFNILTDSSNCSVSENPDGSHDDGVKFIFPVFSVT